jgi:plastocyanin
MEENNIQPQAPKNSNQGSIIAAVVIIVLAIAGFAIWRSSGNRTSSNQVVQQDSSTGAAIQDQGNSGSMITGTGSPAMMGNASSTGMMASSTDMMASSSSHSTAPAPVMQNVVKTFTVKGQNFSFAPNEIKVNKGDQVKIVFENTGGFHDLVIDEFNVKTPTIPTGQSATIQFTADKTGTFQYYCSVSNHRQMGMVGNIIVQ